MDVLYFCGLIQKHDVIMDSREKGIYKVTLVGSVVNALLLILKFVAGILGNSAAMIADGVHSLSDFITDIVVLVFARLAGKPVDSDHDYGHGKYETLATLIIGIALLIVGFGILWNGASSVILVLRGGTLHSPGVIAFWAAIISIVSKEALYRYSIVKGKKYNSPAVIANAWHHRSDALSSIGTAFGIGGAILLGDKWVVLDPIAAIVVSFFICKVAVQLISPCLGELLEKSLPDSVEKQIEDIVNAEPGVSDPHDLRTRRIGSYSAVDVHVRMDGNMLLKDAHEKSTVIETRIKKLLGPATIVYIHYEPQK